MGTTPVNRVSFGYAQAPGNPSATQNVMAGAPAVAQGSTSNTTRKVVTWATWLAIATGGVVAGRAMIKEGGIVKGLKSLVGASHDVETPAAETVAKNAKKKKKGGGDKGGGGDYYVSARSTNASAGHGAGPKPQTEEVSLDRVPDGPVDPHVGERKSGRPNAKPGHTAPLPFRVTVPGKQGNAGWIEESYSAADERMGEEPVKDIIDLAREDKAAAGHRRKRRHTFQTPGYQSRNTMKSALGGDEGEEYQKLQAFKQELKDAETAAVNGTETSRPLTRKEREIEDAYREFNQRDQIEQNPEALPAPRPSTGSTREVTPRPASNAVEETASNAIGVDELYPQILQAYEKAIPGDNLLAILSRIRAKMDKDGVAALTGTDRKFVRQAITTEAHVTAEILKLSEGLTPSEQLRLIKEIYGVDAASLSKAKQTMLAKINDEYDVPAWKKAGVDVVGIWKQAFNNYQ